MSKKITQEELAFQLNTSSAYISNIERGIKKPSLQKLTDIADIMGVTINDFIYTSTNSSDSFYDSELSYMISLCTPEKQRIITKNIAEIISTIISE
jgi:Helix-turn-helix.